MDSLLVIEAPVIEWGLLAPVVLVLVAACLGILVEAFLPRRDRFVAQVVLTIGGLSLALVQLLIGWLQGGEAIAAVGSVAVDGPTRFIWALVLIFSLLAALLFAERRVSGGSTAFAAMAAAVPSSGLEREATIARTEHSEVFPLLLFAVAGMMLFPASNDLLTMFVALEIFSLPLYLLSGLARRRRLLSQEAALKYFLLGSLSSAIFLFGVALLYGYSGSFTLTGIDQAISSPTQSSTLLIGGLGLVAVGLLFKVGAVPFHNWTPDVYMGAPTAVTGFMAVCTKIAAIGALLRVFYVALGGARWDWQPMLAAIAVLTMAVGSVVALLQTDIKRLLAYSSIAHAGFLLTALVGASAAATGLADGQVGSVSSVLFYLAAYGFATLGAFAIVTMVRDAGGEVTAIAGWAGLGKRQPLLASTFALFLLSFAGIPVTAGFIGKWAVFVAAWRGGFPWLVVVAVVMSLVAAYFYVRLIVVMFFSEPAQGTEVGKASSLTWTVVSVGAVATLALGLFPGTVLNLAIHAGQFLR